MNYKDMILLPVVVGIVSLLKGMGLQKKYCPIVSFVIGTMFGIIFESEGDIKKGILGGMITGLAASGLYSNGKELVKKASEKKKQN